MEVVEVEKLFDGNSDIPAVWLQKPFAQNTIIATTQTIQLFLGVDMMKTDDPHHDG